MPLKRRTARKLSRQRGARYGANVYSYAKACEDKAKYDSQHQARAAAMRTRGSWGNNLREYQCIWCQHWHTGHYTRV